MSSNTPMETHPGEETTAGSYFVSNYPPYEYWKRDQLAKAYAAIDTPPVPGTPLGIYVHIPFCRKRCHFCYFKVYTDKKANEIEAYIDAVIAEMRLYRDKAFIGGRKPSFVYFGGGTPSYISSGQLTRLVTGMRESLDWDGAEEIAFECEPGTITEPKLQAIRDLGMTRLSLGIENFDDAILELNGRAHASKEIARAYDFARSIGFDQINIDLIAGMMGETPENWRECVRKTIEMSPESITVYQMEIPFNTTIFAGMRVSGDSVAPVADWRTKRAWIAYAFEEFEKAGYTISSAYTAVKDPAKTKFLYRDMLWRGADMMGVGVSSISHVGGVHFQNEHDMDKYMARVELGEIPLARANQPSSDELMIREFILQMKLGRVKQKYFDDKFGVHPSQRFASTLGDLEGRGFVTQVDDEIRLSRDGLLQVDKLLHEFFLPQHRAEHQS